MTHLADPLVGRAGELQALEATLGRLPGAVELVGEPGIGKTRLLAELERISDRRGCLVLSGSASELERDLPFWVFVDALEDYVRGLPPSVPTPPDLPWARSGSLADERHRTHQAVRELLALLGARQPLVLMLDDLHWADPGSLELLGSLLRRPPAAPVLLAVAVRPRQVPEKLLPALERAPSRRHADAARAVRAHARGREGASTARRLTRSTRRAAATRSTCSSSPARSGRTGQVPRDVTAALAEELALLGDDARRLLQGAAVAGDPFVPELAAAAADVADPLDVLDALLDADLVRPTEVPRRFRFRHPLVRRAVYDGAPAGWRLQAHERAAAVAYRRRARPARRTLRARGRHGRGRGVARRRPRRRPERARERRALVRRGTAAGAGRPAGGPAVAADAARPRALAVRRVRRRPRGARRGAAAGAAGLPAARAGDQRLRDDRAAAGPARRGPRPRGARARRARRSRCAGRREPDDGTGRRRVLPGRLGAHVGVGAQGVGGRTQARRPAPADRGDSAGGKRGRVRGEDP